MRVWSIPSDVCTFDVQKAVIYLCIINVQCQPITDISLVITINVISFKHSERKNVTFRRRRESETKCYIWLSRMLV